jgi:hypothetical protein
MIERRNFVQLTMSFASWTLYFKRFVPADFFHHHPKASYMGIG